MTRDLSLLYLHGWSTLQYFLIIFQIRFLSLASLLANIYPHHTQRRTIIPSVCVFDFLPAFAKKDFKDCKKQNRFSLRLTYSVHLPFSTWNNLNSELRFVLFCEMLLFARKLSSSFHILLSKLFLAFYLCVCVHTHLNSIKCDIFTL